MIGRRYPPALSWSRERQRQYPARADFPTLNEKRAAAGFAALEGGDALPRLKRGGGKRNDEHAFQTN